MNDDGIQMLRCPETGQRFEVEKPKYQGERLFSG
jgi:hypothetical protein